MWCKGCNQDKDLECFSWRNKSKGKRASRCKECHKEYVREHYLNNTESYVDRAKISNKEYVNRNRLLLIAYLTDKCCLDCGEKDMVVFEFDHKDPKRKKLNVSRMVSNSNSWETIKEEIDKCEIRCSNCHRRKTSKQLGFYKLLA